MTQGQRFADSLADGGSETLEGARHRRMLSGGSTVTSMSLSDGEDPTALRPSEVLGTIKTSISRKLGGLPSPQLSPGPGRTRSAGSEASETDPELERAVDAAVNGACAGLASRSLPAFRRAALGASPEGEGGDAGGSGRMRQSAPQPCSFKAAARDTKRSIVSKQHCPGFKPRAVLLGRDRTFRVEGRF